MTTPGILGKRLAVIRIGDCQLVCAKPVHASVRRVGDYAFLEVVGDGFTFVSAEMLWDMAEELARTINNTVSRSVDNPDWKGYTK